MNIVNKNIKALCAGGTELTKQLDKQTHLSEIIRSLKIKKRGLGLEKIALSLISARIDDPRSVLKSVDYLKENSSAMIGFNIDPDDVHERTFYRGLELLGEHDKDIYTELIDNVDEKYGLNLRRVLIDWTSTFFHGIKCKLAELGYSRDHRPDKKQIKIGLAMSDKQSIPFYYSVEDGGVVDVKQFKRISKVLKTDCLKVH